MKPAEFISEYIGTPFLYNGRSKSGVDCYGLVWLWYKEVNDIILPDWVCADQSRAWISDFMSPIIRDYLEPLAAPMDGAIALGRRREQTNHVGIFFNRGIFHIAERGFASWKELYIAELEFGGHVIYGVPNVKS
jgi:hypothetical protein